MLIGICFNLKYVYINFILRCLKNDVVIWYYYLCDLLIVNVNLGVLNIVNYVVCRVDEVLFVIVVVNIYL